MALGITTQSIRKMDAPSRKLFADLCVRGNPKDGAASALRRYIEEQARELNSEAFFRFMDQLYDCITSFLESNDVAENLGALRAIDELIDIRIGENAVKVAKIAHCMRTTFEVKREPETLVVASKVLGHFAQAGGAMTADEVEKIIKNALEWLSGERVEYRRFASVLILKEMAEHASTVFNVHVPAFIDAIWVALRDPKLEIRERAVDALRACLWVIEKRETRWRVLWYYRMFEATQDGLQRNAPIHYIHGSLLAVGELLRNTGEFMMSRYREVAEIVLHYIEHRDRLVRLSITSLLPRIAHFLRDCFVTNYLAICMKHILNVLKMPAESASGFVALGEMAGVLKGELVPYLPTITSHLHDAIAPRRGRPSMEALVCAGKIAKAIGPSTEPYMRSLLDGMFSSGLSPSLVEALLNITASVPALHPTIQSRLFECISGVLKRNKQVQSRPSAGIARTSSMMASLQVSELGGSALVQVALQTLARFIFKGQDLLEFARETVVAYLEDEDGGIRKDAAFSCCKIVENTLSGVSAAHFSPGRTSQFSAKRRRLVEEIFEKLLIIAVADTDDSVRRSVFSYLDETRGCDNYLAQAECLTAILSALNDEDFEVREYAISVAGRLSEKNPAIVLPALRCYLIQLLNNLKQSGELKCKEESAKLLGCLIRNCERLVLPYIAPIHKSLFAKLCDGTGVNANTGIISGVLVTIGDLARVGGFAMRQYIPELMPLIVEPLLDGAAALKREVSLTTLGQVVQSTGYVITPYNEFPQLLGLLLKMLNGELPWSTRREVLKVIGIIGALDPHAHKQNQLSLPGSHGEIVRATGDPGQHFSSIDELLPVDLWPALATSEDYYSTVAISSLMRILRDPSLSSYHQKVVGSLIFIFKSMGLGCVPYLSKVLPDLLHTVRTCDDGLKEYITWKLGTLVSIVRQHIRKYLPELFSLISELWSSFIFPAASRPVHGYPIFHLLEQLCLALNDEFRAHLPIILPSCIQVLSDAEKFKDYTYVIDVLHTLEVFGGILDEHMHLLLPALTRIFKVDASVDVHRATIRTITSLISRVQVAGHISTLVHHLMFVLDGKNDGLRNDTIDALCCLARALGEDFTVFIPSIRKILLKHRLRHKEFDEIESLLKRREPLMAGNAVSLRHVQRGEVISDPLCDTENHDGGVNSSVTQTVNECRLLDAGEASQRSTKEDWAEWMRHFSIELLKESPSPALRTCAQLAQLQPFVGRELFAAGFISCWTRLPESSQRQLVRSLEMAFSSPNIPPEILASLLNLAEFMEHNERPLPIDIRLLGALAEKCRAFAKALHYKELEFEGACSNKTDAKPASIVEALIHINNQLHQHEAAVGILTHAQQHLDVQLKESWYEKLQRWDDALKAYTGKISEESGTHVVHEATLGQMRCLAALARWEELDKLSEKFWSKADVNSQTDMAPMASSAAWNMGKWDQMAEYASRLEDGDDGKARAVGNNAATSDSSSNGTFFKAVLSVRQSKYDEARDYIERARKCLATEVAGLVHESYERAYSNVVRIQQLSELEEVVNYCTLPAVNQATEGRKALIRNMWNDRIRGTKRNVEVWQALLAVRSVVLHPTENAETWIKFASLCRKRGRTSQARSTLVKLLQFDPDTTPENVRYHGDPQVILAYLKYQWSLGEDQRRKEAFYRLKDLAMDLSQMHGLQQTTRNGISASSNMHITSRVYLKLGTWQWALSPGLDDDSIQEILSAFGIATRCAANWGKAWHNWALFNTAVMSHYVVRGTPGITAEYVAAAVTGFFHSIACSAHSKGVDDSLQDILRLLTLWFNHGASSEVQVALQNGLSLVNINTWLLVLPQIIARIHSNDHAVRELIQSLLVRIGESHPQALMYPLLVACKSVSSLRKHAAQEVVERVRQHSGILVDEAELVSTELIRVSILWHEMWHEGLEEASRLYFGEHNVEGMFNALEPLHKMLEEGAMGNNTTLKERAFIQAYRPELLEAWECCMNFKKNQKDAELSQTTKSGKKSAWDLYYNVFRRIDKQLQTLAALDLKSVSPALLECRDLKLAVPGTYKADSPVVTIASFAPQLIVITSKQRPRKLTIHGSDGEDHAFLLKGHEDLRQDERVMQLFGLVNTLLANSRKTLEKDLSIQRYSVIPLSPNSGLIGWVPNCDTLHQLIREYRDVRKITLNQEHKSMTSFTSDYDHLPLVSKVEVFEYALENSEGNDLARVLWLKSRTSEIWLDRRNNYTRSLAVMSMVGYLLGLGDRHPSNLMLHRYSGKIFHIDFGDCFEASMNREKYPEKVPFRLTRMLVKAMEVCGIEGTFRPTCENVMQVLRTNKDSVMAMMEAFVHDPLVNWRLFNITEAVNQSGDANEALNERAVNVMGRMRNKLTGRDFSPFAAAPPNNEHHYNTFIPAGGDAHRDTTEHGLSVKLQVQKLILQATSHENLCQHYVGWCPFW